MEEYYINLKNFEREIKIRKLITEQNKAKFTNEFPLEDIKVLSTDSLKTEIENIKNKIKLISNNK